jgi:hypothetical protein
MALIKCLECDRTISYPGETTIVIGITTIREQTEPGDASTENLNVPGTGGRIGVRILTLECSAGHRHNYTIPLEQ